MTAFVLTYLLSVFHPHESQCLVLLIYFTYQLSLEFNFLSQFGMFFLFVLSNERLPCPQYCLNMLKLF